MSKEYLISALDVGTRKVCAVIAQLTEDGIEILGVGTHSSRGVSEGVVVNIEEAAESIRRAVEDAEIMADAEINNVYVNIGGSHIQSASSSGSVHLEEGVVRPQDIKRAIDNALAATLPQDRDYIHIVPSEYSIDGYNRIKEPLGMSGAKLDVKIHYVTALLTFVKNLETSCRKAGIKVKEFALGSLAASEAVLTPDEKELGVAMIDIGEGKTSGIIYLNGAIQHTFEIPIGGRFISRDIATGLRVTLREAERIKKEKGIALVPLARKEDEIEISPIHQSTTSIISRKSLAEIIEPRAEEILEIIDENLQTSGFKSLLHAGIVLTGGTAQLSGVDELAEQIFDNAVRIGKPAISNGLSDLVNSSEFSVSVGLILYSAKMEEKGPFANGFLSRGMRIHRGIFNKVKKAFLNVF